jgi:hypothetical protein
MVNAFRAMVLANLIACLVVTIVPDSVWSDLRWSGLLKYDGYGARLVLDHPIYLSLPIIADVIAAVGLAFFQNWGRYLFLALWISGLFSSLVFGVRVTPPATVFLSILQVTLTGGILAIVFISPLRQAFAQEASVAESPSVA